jgi:glycosyltransferase involved in cell wall biosynthesis
MKCGAPVIVGNKTSLPEVVGDAALMIDPFDVNEMAGAIKRVISDSDFRAELRVKGLERAKQFDWKETARRTLAVYERAFSSKRTAH